jgi:hypothetical protein
MGANDPTTAYIIIEHSDGKYYSYRESVDHFKVAEETRSKSGLKKVSETLLDEDCDLSSLPNNTYIVLNVNSKQSCGNARSTDLMIDMWGEKCEEYESLCSACIAWTIYESTGTVPLTSEVSEKIQALKRNSSSTSKAANISHWNCRLVRKFYEESDEYYVAVYEVYYDENGDPILRTEEPVHVDGSTVKEVEKYLKLIKKAMKKPVLDDSIFNK